MTIPVTAASQKSGQFESDTVQVQPQLCLLDIATKKERKKRTKTKQNKNRFRTLLQSAAQVPHTCRVGFVMLAIVEFVIFSPKSIFRFPRR